jgi:hypothetical protein
MDGTDMTIRLSSGMRDAINTGGASGGVKGALAAGFIYIYSGSQPTSADSAATGTLLGKVTKDGDGATGLTLGTSAAGVIPKNPAETWKFTGLADGSAGWFRHCEAGDTPGNSSSTAKRIDGSIGTAGADANIANTNVVTGAVSTVDAYTVTMPGA